MHSFHGPLPDRIKYLSGCLLASIELPLAAAPSLNAREFLKGLFETRPSETVHFSETFDVAAKDIAPQRAAGTGRYHWQTQVLDLCLTPLA